MRVARLGSNQQENIDFTTKDTKSTKFDSTEFETFVIFVVRKCFIKC